MLSIREHRWALGGQWMSKGFQAFRQDIAPWLMFIVCHIGGILVISFIPFVGSIATGILPSMINGLGMRLIHDRVRSDIPMSFGAVQPELQKTGTELFGLGAITWGLNIVAVMPMLVFAVLGLLSAGILGPVMSEIMGQSTHIQGLDESAIILMFIVFFIGLVMSLVLLVLVFMTTVFAPYLIVVRDIKSIDALKLSFKAVYQNPWSMTALSLWWLLYVFGGLLLCGVGVLLTGPIIQLSIYFAAEDIFDSSLNMDGSTPSLIK